MFNMPLPQFMRNLNMLTEHIYPKDVKKNCLYEIQTLGSIISHQPLDSYKEETRYGCVPLTELSSKKQFILALVLKTALKKTKTYRDMLIMSVNTKQGPAEVIILDNKAKEYASGYEGEVVKICCSKNNDTIFAKYIEKASPKIKKYFISIDDIITFNRVSSILKNAEKGQNDLYMRSLISHGKKMPYPKLYGPLQITTQTAELINAKQL